MWHTPDVSLWVSTKTRIECSFCTFSLEGGPAGGSRGLAYRDNTFVLVWPVERLLWQHTVCGELCKLHGAVESETWAHWKINFWFCQSVTDIFSWQNVWFRFVHLLSAYIQVVQGLLIFGLCLGLTGTVLAFPGLECTNIGGGRRSKDRMLIAASALHLVGCECDLFGSNKPLSFSEHRTHWFVSVFCFFFPPCVIRSPSCRRVRRYCLLFIYKQSGRSRFTQRSRSIKSEVIRSLWITLMRGQMWVNTRQKTILTAVSSAMKWDRPCTSAWSWISSLSLAVLSTVWLRAALTTQKGLCTCHYTWQSSWPNTRSCIPAGSDQTQYSLSAADSAWIPLSVGKEKRNNCIVGENTSVDQQKYPETSLLTRWLLSWLCSSSFDSFERSSSGCRMSEMLRSNWLLQNKADSDTANVANITIPKHHNAKTVSASHYA